MAITAEDINLEMFLKKVCPTAFQEAGKLILSNYEFLQIASYLKIEFTLQRILRKLK